MNLIDEKAAKIVQTVVKTDLPQLLTCTGIFTYCTLTNAANVMQQVGIIFGGIGAVVIVAHRIFTFIKDAKQ